ncbi:MAG: non-heme iron oxygenase ferredoxin subunit [Casimicrobiaceae bacterium]
MTSTGNLITLCETAQVPEGGALKVEPPGYALAVFNLGGKFFVIDDQCTHGPGSLSEGTVEDDVVECDFHNGAFNIITGEVVAPPCMEPVRTYRVVVQDGKIAIDPDQLADGAGAR